MNNIEQALDEWKQSLLSKLEHAGLYARNPTTHKWKALFRSLVLRESVAWRAHDLLVQAHALHNAGHTLGSRILIRSALETLAVLNYLNQMTARVLAGSEGFHQFSLKTSRLLLGSKDKTTKHEAHMATGRTSVGTLAWARRSGGRLSGYDRLGLMAEAMLVRLNLRLRAQNKPPFSVEVSLLRIPDSALCVAAGQLLASVSQPWLVNHCLRTFLWATILGKMEHRTYDEEVLFVASALHDLGLTDAGAKLSTVRAECFAVDGAFAAEAFLAHHGVEDKRRELIAEAISLHLNIRVPLTQGVEAHLLHEGAGLDVIGARHGELTAATRDGVVDLHPRMEMKNSLVALMKQQSSTRHLSRAAFLCSHGFISMIRRSAFAS